MSYYILKNKDKQLSIFLLNKRNVDSVQIDKNYKDDLPLPLKRIFFDKEGLVEFEDKNFYYLNEEGIYIFEEWLFNREIPSNRENISKYLADKKNPTKLMLDNNAYSFVDNFWIHPLQDNELSWKDIKVRRDNVDEIYSYKVNGKKYYKGLNSTLGGQLEKYWYKRNNQLMLCKRTNKQDDILSLREIMASLIYKKQGYKNYCSYKLVYDKENEIVGCKCKAFINNDKTILITANDLLEEFNRTMDNNCYELIIDFANNYGLDKQTTRDYLDIQAIVDFLITNRDRHQNNIGFLMDSETKKIISPAPIFDSGSASAFEGIYPESAINTSINGLYTTEKKLLSHVSNFNLIDIKKLPSADEIKNLLDKSTYISSNRKEKLLNIYEEKVNILEKLQEKQKEGNNNIVDEVFSEQNKLKNDNFLELNH